MCLCSAVALVELQLINSIDDVALALLFFLFPVQSLNLRVSSPFHPWKKEEAEQAVCAVLTEEGVLSHPLCTPPPIALFIHHSFAAFMWSTGWKFNLMTCLQARNMILKPVTVKQRCHLHNDPSKIGLQPLPWQLVDKQKNGGRARRMDGRLGGWWAGWLIAESNSPVFSPVKAEL